MPRDLSIGMNGADVKAVQQLLNYHLGDKFAPLVDDGNFGSGTRARTMEFQRRNENFPPRLPYGADYPREFRKPLAIDGIVGQHTLHMLIDVRTIDTPEGNPASFDPVDSPDLVQGVRQSSRNVNRFGLKISASADPPAPNPSPAPNIVPPRTFHFIQLQPGTSASVAPWGFSPFTLAGQFTVLAKNEGKPDFLFTTGVQASLNDGNPKTNGRWTGQGFLQMGLGLNKTISLFGRTLDLANPFVQLMISKNLKSQDPSLSLGLAVGNQISWKLIERLLPNAKSPDDTQDIVSVFFNGQVVGSTSLSDGKSSALTGSGMLGMTYTFFGPF